MVYLLPFVHKHKHPPKHSPILTLPKASCFGLERHYYFVQYFFLYFIEHNMFTSALFRTAQNLYSRLVHLLNFGQDFLLLAMRLYWGWQFFQTGKGKLMNFDRTVDFFTSLNIPFPAFNVAMAGTTECLGGLLLLVGLFSRVVSLQLIVVLMVAYLTADADAVKNILEKPDDFTAATPFLFLLATLTVAFFGAGKWSLDEFLRRFIAKKQSSY